MARYGWSWDETLWGVSYVNLRMMALDAIYIHTSKEAKKKTDNEEGGPATFTDFLAMMKGVARTKQ